MIVYSKYSASLPKKRRGKYSKSLKRLGLFCFACTTTILILLKVVSWLNAQDIFYLKNIEFQGNRFVTEKELLSLFQVDSTQSLFDIDLKSIAEKIKKHPFVKEVYVSRRLPGDLVIKVVEMEPLAILNHKKLTVVDENGNSLPDLNPFELVDYPIISNMETPETGNEKLDFVMNFLKMVKIGRA